MFAHPILVREEFAERIPRGKEEIWNAFFFVGCSKVVYLVSCKTEETTYTSQDSSQRMTLSRPGTTERTHSGQAFMPRSHGRSA